MARMQSSLFAQLNALAAEISQSGVKTAAEKAAGPTPADPGTYVGASSHPTASVDNNVQKATEGARAAEYEADLKKQQGPVGVDSTPELSQNGRQNDVQLNIGTHASSVGEDPAVEGDYKGTKDDPGTAHPAKATDGEKYSAVSFKQARAHCGQLGNDILANLINFGTGNLTKQSEMPEFLKKKIEGKKEGGGEGKMPPALAKAHEASESKSEESAEHDDKEAAYAAGYELAAYLGMDKAAAAAVVSDVCNNTLRESEEMAALYIGYMRAKAAAADPAEQASEGEDHASPGDMGSGAGDAPAEGGAPAGLEAMMGGAGGGDPSGGAGAGLSGGPQPSGDEAVQELAMALEELGIPPEALIQALSHGGGAGGAGGEGGPMGGAPADMGAAMGGAPADMGPPKMASANAIAQELHAIGQTVVGFKRAGKFQVKEARTKRSRELRDMMKQHVIELVNR